MPGKTIGSAFAEVTTEPGDYVNTPETVNVWLITQQQKAVRTHRHVPPMAPRRRIDNMRPSATGQHRHGSPVY